MIEHSAEQVQTVMPAYEIEIGTEPLDQPARNSVGGWPFLDDDQPWPECFCGERLALYFQLDIPADVEPFGGDHLLVFHCRAHNEASDPPELTEGRLVPQYWNAPQPTCPRPFWRILLQRHATRPVDAEPSVCALPLTLRPFTDTPDDRGHGALTSKVGGAPFWCQEPEHYQCACGADLVYLCQIREDTEFAVHPGQPEQPHSFPGAYVLFLGNEVYVLACPDHCDPAAVWPVNQN
ncbi:hypothetical protein ACIQWA_03240 [Kitasatospora sp. NPDC098652]|uniref:hypothetical protein n=1 Tax=Kitasatospora sp. NPDC098652 TaxID=3364095 RepID=UPI00380E09B8